MKITKWIIRRYQFFRIKRSFRKLFLKTYKKILKKHGDKYTKEQIVDSIAIKIEKVLNEQDNTGEWKIWR